MSLFGVRLSASSATTAKLVRTQFGQRINSKLLGYCSGSLWLKSAVPFSTTRTLPSKWQNKPQENSSKSSKVSWGHQKVTAGWNTAVEAARKIKDPHKFEREMERLLAERDIHEMMEKGRGIKDPRESFQNDLRTFRAQWSFVKLCVKHWDEVSARSRITFFATVLNPLALLAMFVSVAYAGKWVLFG